MHVCLYSVRRCIESNFFRSYSKLPWMKRREKSEIVAFEKEYL